MIIGHEKQKSFLMKMVSSEKIPHALIFQGASGLGKKKLAIDIFKKINCIKNGNQGCDNCESCLSINQLIHPDLNIIEAEGKMIQVDQIREMIHRNSFHCYSAFFKWTIINDAHLMNKEASNSLLKTLEEPNKKTVIILITDRPESILSTIKSRTQRIKFYPLKNNEIKLLLENKKCDAKRAEEITSFSFGVPGKAINFFENKDLIKDRKDKIKKFAEIISMNTPFYLKFQYAKDISDNPEIIKETLEIWLNYLRILFLEKIKNEKFDKSFYKIKNLLKETESALYLISKTNVGGRIIIENLILNL
jgi:DNA polymerase III subunit delta'